MKSKHIEMRRLIVEVHGLAMSTAPERKPLLLEEHAIVCSRCASLLGRILDGCGVAYGHYTDEEIAEIASKLSMWPYQHPKYQAVLRTCPECWGKVQALAAARTKK